MHYDVDIINSKRRGEWMESERVEKDQAVTLSPKTYSQNKYKMLKSIQKDDF